MYVTVIKINNLSLIFSGSIIFWYTIKKKPSAIDLLIVPLAGVHPHCEVTFWVTLCACGPPAKLV